MGLIATPIDALRTVIDLSGWKRDEDFEYHPIGSKPKRNYICPLAKSNPLLVPGHTYIFKVAQGWLSGQMWAEAVSYQVGIAAGLEIPPCFIAYDPSTDEWGALIEFFVGYPGQIEPERLTHGADLLQGKGFTQGSDRPHNLKTNIEVCSEYGIPDAALWWLKLVAFDSFIGNTDRHTENWGILRNNQNDTRMAPIFDNGTSLGYQQADAKLPLFVGDRVDSFIDKGTHHMSWDLANENRTCHLDLCRVTSAMDVTGAVIENVIQGSSTALDSALDACTLLDAKPAFTPARAEFVRRLLGRRGERMIGLVGNAR